jgi:hypothetical protein
MIMRYLQSLFHNYQQGDMRLRSDIIIFLLFSIFAISRVSFSSEAWPLPLFTSDPKDVIAFAKKVPTQSNTDASLLDFNISFHIDPEGKARVVYRALYRILTQAGVKQLSSVSCQWDSWRQSRPRLRARVITDDEKAYVLDESTIREAGIPSQLVQGIFSDVKLLSAPLPGVRPNAVV